MKFAKHGLLIAILAIVIYFVAWRIYGAMIDNIFSHRDTGYSQGEFPIGIILDQIMSIYYFPVIILSLPLLRDLVPIDTPLHFPGAIFISLSVFWSLLIYGIIAAIYRIKTRIQRIQAEQGTAAKP